MKKRILAITGAGASVRSGLPTYTGPDGHYNEEANFEGRNITEIVNVHTLKTQPDLVWRYFKENVLKFQECEPNPTHEALAALEIMGHEVINVTQNIDGLLQKAGCKNVYEIHGNARNIKCSNVKCGYTEEIANMAEYLLEQEKLPPICPECKKNALHPNVVLFGDIVDNESIKIFNSMIDDPFHLIFVIGTEALFPYIQHPVKYSRLKGEGVTIEVNPGETMISELVDLKYYDEFEVVLNKPEIVRMLKM